jgi:hypothetical protein
MVDQLEIELFKVLTLPGRGAERGEEQEQKRHGPTISKVCVVVLSFPFQQRYA